MKRLLAALGAFTLICGAFVSLAWAATRIRNATIINSTLDSSPVGATTPSTGAFTTLTCTTCPLVNVNLAFSHNTLSSNVSVSASSLTSVQSKTISSWPSACGTNGCRVRISYWYYVNGGTSTGQMYVTDGTNPFAESGGFTGNNNTFYSASGISPSTFSSSSGSVTFTAFIFDSGNCTVETSSLYGTGVPSALQVEIIPSN